MPGGGAAAHSVRWLGRSRGAGASFPPDQTAGHILSCLSSVDETPSGGGRWTRPAAINQSCNLAPRPRACLNPSISFGCRGPTSICGRAGPVNPDRQGPGTSNRAKRGWDPSGGIFRRGRGSEDAPKRSPRFLSPSLSPWGSRGESGQRRKSRESSMRQGRNKKGRSVITTGLSSHYHRFVKSLPPVCQVITTDLSSHYHRLAVGISCGKRTRRRGAGDFCAQIRGFGAISASLAAGRTEFIVLRGGFLGKIRPVDKECHRVGGLTVRIVNPDWTSSEPALSHYHESKAAPIIPWRCRKSATRHVPRGDRSPRRRATVQRRRGPGGGDCGYWHRNRSSA